MSTSTRSPKWRAVVRRPSRMLPLLAGFGLLALTGTAVASAAPSDAAHPALQHGAAALPVGGGYTLAFDDEFNGTSVDTSKWNYRTDQKAKSAQLPENVTEGDGHLRINVKKQTVGDFAYTGGGVVSKQKLRYGYYEVRARTTAGAGWHSAFWAQAGDGSDTYNADRRTEIDGFEVDSSTPSTIRHNIIPWFPAVSGYNPTSNNYTLPFDTSAAWHTYGFEWTEQHVAFYVDGKLAYEAPYPASIDTHDPLNIWLTDIATQTVDDSALPGHCDFDYVRYYQRDYYVDNATGTGYSETGSWADSNQTGYTAGTKSRYATRPGATATWRPDLLAAGKYHVYLYKEASQTAADPDQTVEVGDGHRVHSSVVNGTIGATGWLDLGTYQFGRGTSGYVKLTGSAAYSRANAVKFVRQVP
ncbi:family 16 glycosylhydrolase [Streptomyces sp. NPDC087270]|uniref:family 16 glycosylhydrolase n=1 Tax=Streptomyces sp. NPDC087270 TaxID=3365774 RepID=UPI00382D1E10